MESIFHEKQEGYLCAQHCLNALLQGPYFNAVDLANFAQQMDEEERLRMAESGTDSEDYQMFLEQPSGNMDDSGYFSVQVISSALKVWGLELIPYNSTEPTAILAQNDPSQMVAYICNYKGHWFTIRKLGNQWFNLNSILNGPQLISDTYLAIYLAQLLQEGYSIFIIIGALPYCEADEVLKRCPVVPQSTIKEKDTKFQSKGYRLGTKEDDCGKPSVPNSQFQDSTNVPSCSQISKEINVNQSRERIIPITIEGREDDEENEELQRALQLSMQDAKTFDESVKLRLNIQPDTDKPNTVNETENTDEEDDLKKALKLSLECVTAPPTPDPEDIRWKRLSYLNNLYPRTSGESSPKLNS